MLPHNRPSDDDTIIQSVIVDETTSNHQINLSSNTLTHKSYGYFNPHERKNKAIQSQNPDERINQEIPFENPNERIHFQNKHLDFDDNRLSHTIGENEIDDSLYIG